MNYWIKSSDNDYDVMLDLKEKKKYILFIFGQMVIEKLLKAYYAKTNKNAPYAPRIHELAYLANKMNMKLTEKQEDMFETISDFNMEARYGDYKYKGVEKMVERIIDREIMDIVKKYAK